MRVRVTQDTTTLLRILRVVAPALDNNPRRIKQFINLFRLRTFIAAETGLFDSPKPAARTIEKFGKFVALTLRWPLLVRDLETEPRLLGILQHTALGKEPEVLGRVPAEWLRGASLKTFLIAGCGTDMTADAAEQADAWSLDDVDVTRLLGVSPRVRNLSEFAESTASALTSDGGREPAAASDGDIPSNQPLRTPKRKRRTIASRLKK